MSSAKQFCRRFNQLTDLNALLSIVVHHQHVLFLSSCCSSWLLAADALQSLEVAARQKISAEASEQELDRAEHEIAALRVTAQASAVTDVVHCPMHRPS